MTLTKKQIEELQDLKSDIKVNKYAIFGKGQNPGILKELKDAVAVIQTISATNKVLLRLNVATFLIMTSAFVGVIVKLFITGE
jgi:hypothetical protein